VLHFEHEHEQEQEHEGGICSCLYPFHLPAIALAADFAEEAMSPKAAGVQGFLSAVNRFRA